MVIMIQADSVLKGACLFGTAMRKATFIVVAVVSLALGVLGLFLPVLPTTPFLLLTSYLLIRVSPTWHQRLLSASVIGPVLREWQYHKGIRRETRRRALTVILLAAGAIWFAIAPPLPVAVVMAIGTGVGIVVVFRLPLIEDKSAAQAPS